MNSENVDPKGVAKAVLAIVLMVAFVLALALGGWSGCKAVKRAQQRADAHNEAVVEQRRVEKVEALANQRRAEARGIRDAQETINKTLTPLYVQHEAVGAQLEMARSKNHTIIYVPAGTNGTPVITQSGDANDALSSDGG